MKFRRHPSWLPSVAIALLLIGLGWKNSIALTQLREKQQELKARAVALGINPDVPLRHSKRFPSPATHPDFHEIALAYLQCGKDFKSAYNEHAIRELGPASRDRIVAAIDGVVSLNRSELQRLIEILRGEPGLEPRVRQNLLTFPLARWGKMDRRALLDYLAESPGLKEELRSSHSFLLRTNLDAWITEAPGQILAWMRQRKGELPEELLDSALSKYARRIAMTDPLGTFDLIQELSDRPHRYYPNILRESQLSVADRTEIISRVRQMADDLGEEKEKQKFLTKNINAMILSSGHETDFYTAVGTIEAARLDLDQIEFIWNPALDDLGYHIKHEETGQWILWLREHIPVDKSQRRIDQLLERWQKRDPEKAAAFVRDHHLE